MAKGRRQPPELRVDTYDALASLVRALGGKVRPAAKILETGYSHLWQQLNHKRPPPTVDSLALYTKKVYANTGLKMVLTITPDMRLYYSISCEDHQTEGVVLGP